MVGVCAALELQARGAEVTLIDRVGPGRETSYGNAGVLARSSLVPLNNPSLFRALPGVVTNRSTAVRYDPWFLLRNAGWWIGFLSNARASRVAETTRALDGLIRISVARHLALMSDLGLSSRLSDRGWIFLYRDIEGYRRGGWARAVLGEHGVGLTSLTPAELAELEPGLKAIFPHAVWVRDGYSVDDPGAVVTGYADCFERRGGIVLKAEVTDLEEDGGGVTLRFADGRSHASDHAVLCLGPWGRRFLEHAGYRVRMAYERGYHRHFSGCRTRSGQAMLGRPVYDTAAGYVLAPMARGLRLSTGVELADRDAPHDARQIIAAERAAREALNLGESLDDTPWIGSRPTFPDSRPAIGPVPGSGRLSMAFGHQHIGFMTGPGTAQVLADLIEGRPPPIPAEPFRPERFIRRV